MVPSGVKICFFLDHHPQEYFSMQDWCAMVPLFICSMVEEVSGGCWVMRISPPFIHLPEMNNSSCEAATFSSQAALGIEMISTRCVLHWNVTRFALTILFQQCLGIPLFVHLFSGCRARLALTISVPTNDYLLHTIHTIFLSRLHTILLFPFLQHACADNFTHQAHNITCVFACPTN